MFQSSSMQRLLGIVLFAFILGGFLIPLTAHHTQAQVVIDATPYLDSTRSDYGLQQAIDAAAAMGGAIVQLPAGTFELETYLQLKTGVTLKGQGATTILKAKNNEQRVDVTATYSAGSTRFVKVADVSSLSVGMIVYIWRSQELKFRPISYEIRSINASTSTIELDRLVSDLLTANVSQVGFGLYTKLTQAANGTNSTILTLHVADPTVFHPGQALTMKSTASSPGGEAGWGLEENSVVAINAAAKTITLKNPLRINALNGTVVAQGHGVILAQGNRSGKIYVTDIGIQDLVIEGWNSAVKPAFYHFYIGAINLVYCKRAHIERVTVRYWHSDGISLQSCFDSTVVDSVSTANRGHGFHPGTTSENLEFVRITATWNQGFGGYGTDGDGLYYCWGNKNVNIRQSLLSDNAGSGIGDLGGGNSNNTSPDTNDIIEDNLIERNGMAGIRINGGTKTANTLIQRNIIRDNSQIKSGYAGIHIEGENGYAWRYTITNNTIEVTSGTSPQQYAIYERNRSYSVDYNTITNNQLTPHSGGNIVTVGTHDVVANNVVRPYSTPTPSPAPTQTPPLTSLPTATPQGVALLVIDTALNSSGDTTVLNRLQQLGYTVVVKDDNAVTLADANGKDLILLSSSVQSNVVGSLFRDVAVPIVTWEHALYPYMNMTGATADVDYGNVTGQWITIVDPGSGLAGGQTGSVLVVNAAQTLVWGVPAAGAHVTAHIDGAPAKNAVFSYDTGATMVNMNAPARRVGFFALDTAMPSMTSAGWELFDAAVTWARYVSADPTVTPVTPTSAPTSGTPTVTPIGSSPTATPTIDPPTITPIGSSPTVTPVDSLPTSTLTAVPSTSTSVPPNSTPVVSPGTTTQPTPTHTPFPTASIPVPELKYRLYLPLLAH